MRANRIGLALGGLALAAVVLALLDRPGARPSGRGASRVGLVERETPASGAASLAAPRARIAERESAAVVSERVVRGAAALSLTVAGEDGAPRPDATAVLREPSASAADGSSSSSELLHRREESGADGRVDFADVRTGAVLELVLQADGCAARSLALAPLLPGEQRDLGRVALERGHLLEGLVTSSSGTPVPEAEVALVRADGYELYHLAGDLALERSMGPEVVDRAQTDGRGHFRFAGVARGTYKLIAGARGLLDGSLGPLRVPHETGERLGLALEPGLAASVHVVDERERPLPGARVALLGPTLPSRTAALAALERHGVETDAQGRCRIEGLTADPDRLVIASAEGRVIAKRAGVQPGSEAVLRVVPAFALTGRVLTGDRRPVGAAAVRLAPEVGTETADVLSAGAALTDATGHFRIEGLAQGDHRLWVGLAGQELDGGTVWVGEGSPPQEVRLGDTAGLTVVVTSDAGEPIADVLVEVLARAADPSAASVRQGRTDPEGRAEIFGLVAGDYRVRASSNGRAMKEEAHPIAALPAQVELVIPALGALALEVVDTQGDPVPRTRVQLLALEQGAVEPLGGTLSTDDSGRATWTALVPGHFRAQACFPTPGELLGIAGDGGSSIRSRVDAEVASGRVTEARLVLQECTLRIQVQGAGTPTPASVGVSRQGKDEILDLLTAFVTNGQEVWTKTDARGRAQLVVPEPGDYVVFARSSVQAPATAVPVRVAGSGATVTVELERGSVLGQLAREHGREQEPVRGARVRLLPVDQLENTLELSVTSGPDDRTPLSFSSVLGETVAYSDASGRFHFTEVPPGSYRVEVQHPAHAPWASPSFELASEGRMDLGEIRLSSSCVVRGVVEAEIEAELGTEGGLGLVRLLAEDDRVVGTKLLGKGGGFQFDRVPPGRYRLVTQVNEWIEEGASFELAPGRPSEHRIHLP